jgi:hypothetical protein
LPCARWAGTRFAVPDCITSTWPSWLKIDEGTGWLTGTPDAPGKVQVVVTVRLHREVEDRDLDALAGGLRKVTGMTTEKMGPAIQKFVIEVTP